MSPRPRVELGERLRGMANAAIDVSGGLAGDLGHILERLARRRGGRVFADSQKFFLPSQRSEPRARLRASGGDDYELLFTARRRGARIWRWRELGLPLTRIGAIQSARRLAVLDQGKPMTFKPGFDHFA
jgi:thiamine-monophosphate kinase